MAKDYFSEEIGNTAVANAPRDYFSEEVKQKPIFSNQQEADIAQKQAQKDLRIAQINATPLAQISSGLDLMTKPAMNASLGNIPDIVSKKTTGESYVPADSQVKWMTEPLGMAGGASGAAVAGVGNAMKTIPSIVEKGFASLPFLQKAAAVGKSTAMGAAGMATQLPGQDNLVDNVKQYAGQVAAGAALGPVVETGIKGAIGIKNAFKPVEDKLFDAYNYVFGVKGKIPQNLKTAKADTIAKVKTIQDNIPNEMENPLTGENFTTPSNRYETAIAHTEAKKNIWKKVTELSQGATEADAKINLPSVVIKAYKDTIKGFGTIASRSTKRETINAIKKQARLIMDQGDISPAQAEEFMKSLFDDIKAVRQSGQPVDYSIKDFYSNLQRNLGNETDNVITNTLEKHGYKDARREYAIAKSSEKEVLAAANKFLKEHGQYQGVAHPITNIWALNDILHGAVTGDVSGVVRGVTVKAASKLLDFMKNPDNKVKMIFDLARKIPSKNVADYVKPVTAELVPKGGYNNIPIPSKKSLPSSSPMGLPDKSIQMGPTTRSGVDRPWENVGLPSPRTAGQSSGRVIRQGTSYKEPQKIVTDSPPKYGTDKANMLYGQMKAKEKIPLHPAKDAREFKNSIYIKNSRTSISDNIGIKPEQVDNIVNIKDLLDSSEKGTNSGISYGGSRQKSEKTFWGTKSNVPEFLKDKYTTKTLSDMLKNKLEGGKVTPSQREDIQKLLKHFYPEE